MASSRCFLDPFQTFLERLSQEIEEEQLESLKFMLENHIPAGTLEKCKTARQLFKRMKQQSLLRSNNLDFLEQLLTEAKRSDLVEIVKDFKGQPTMEIDSGYPGNYGIRFPHTLLLVIMYILYFNFILGLKFISLCSRVWYMSYMIMTQNTGK